MPKYEGKPNFSFLKPPRPKNRKKSVKRMAASLPSPPQVEHASCLDQNIKEVFFFFIF